MDQALSKGREGKPKNDRKRNNRRHKPRDKLPKSEKDDDVKKAAAKQPPSNDSQRILTDQRFSELDIGEPYKRALAETFQYEFMSPVQAETLPHILEGKDVLAKAKTGTGKTLGFLIPTLQRLKESQRSVGALIISPTRELAFQIHKEAETLATFTKIRAVALVGGTNINQDLRKLKGTVHVVVATPGRLLDHLQNQGMNVNKLQTLVLDEADQLLDMGFRPDLERIFSFLPETRQTLLFSATLPDAVQKMASVASLNCTLIDTVHEDDDPTHSHVPQSVITTTSPRDQLFTLAALLKQETKGDDYKVLVFFPTARWTGFWANLFRKTIFPNIVDIHSRKSQSVRQKISASFVTTHQGILFSSDVSARGMDYPNVTAVIQVGWTERATYIHRLGRTARAGKQGKGFLVLTEYEAHHMVNVELKEVPVKPAVAPSLDATIQKKLEADLKSINDHKELLLAAQQSYAAWLGYYKTHIRKYGWSTTELVAEANYIAKEMGLAEQPKLLKKTIGMMGLKNVPGLLIDHENGGGGRGGGGRGGGGRGRGGRGDGKGRGRGGGGRGRGRGGRGGDR